jgi:hypothetical protein
MASKTITVSLPESLIWKLGRLNKATGISKSGIVGKALLLVIAEFASFTFPGGQMGSDVSLEDIEQEYSKREV